MTAPADDAATARSPEEETKAKFRAALEAKKNRRSGTQGAARSGGGLEGHAHDSAHGHKVFRRKSG